MGIESMGLGKVAERIANIEQKFGIKPIDNNKNDNSFADNLNEAVNGKSDAEINGTGKKSKFSQEDITRMVYMAAKKYGVDEKLALAVAQTESGLNADAVSPVGAEGVMQLMPDTAKSLGVRDNKDPRENIDGGVHYLKKMLDEFGDDTNKALAAYNAGPGTVNRFNGVPPYRETREYVDKVLKLYKGE